MIGKARQVELTEKQKKHNKVAMIIVGCVIVLCIIGSFLPDSQTEDTQPTTSDIVESDSSTTDTASIETEDIVKEDTVKEDTVKEDTENDNKEAESAEIAKEKEAALMIDQKAVAIVEQAEIAFQSVQNVITSDGTDLELYVAADSAKDSIDAYSIALYDIDGIDYSNDYIQECNLYIFNYSEICKNIMLYVDEGKTSYAAKIQEGSDAASSYVMSLAAARLTYLSDAGFSTDEIDEIIGAAESE